MTRATTVAAAVAGVVAALGGCHGKGAATGPDATKAAIAAAHAKVATIALCTTTGAEVRGWAGEPLRDGRQGRLRIQDWVLVEDPQLVLAIALDDHDVVVDLTYDTPGGASWLPTSQCAATPAAPAPAAAP